MKKYVPKAGEYPLLRKFPMADLKAISRLECNIDNIPEEDREKVIDSSKRLRLLMKVNEKMTCFNCTKKDQCKFFELLPKTKNDDRSQSASIRDLQTVLHGMYSSTLPYKLDNGNKNLHLLTNNADIMDLNNEEENSNITSASFDYKKVVRRISNKDWNHANILMELMNETYEDLLYNNGIVLKTLINSYIESKKEEEEAQLLDNEADQKAKERENDPYVKLLRDLKTCSNRKDRRKLLARFNQAVGFGWGEFRKVVDKTKMYENTEEDKNNADQARKKYYQIESSSHRNGPYREVGSIYNNNTYISAKNLENIEGTRNQKKLVTNHFSQKIDMKKAKFKTIQSQQNLSLLMNQSRDGNQVNGSEKSYVKVPGAEYKKAMEYLEHENGDSESQHVNHVEDFKNYVQEKRDENSVDIRKTINKKLNKIDRTLEENKKFTLKKQIEESKYLTNGNNLIEETNETHKIALNEFENSLKLESGDHEGSNLTMEKIYDSNKNLEKSGQYKNNSLPSKIVDIKDEMQNIQFIKQSSSYNKSDNSMEFYKQQNLEQKEKISKGQKQSKIKKILDNKHKYKAENYYNSTNIEHLAYEKDSDISKSIQFEKSIRKDPKIEQK
jgi:hypothetical protein